MLKTMINKNLLIFVLSEVFVTPHVVTKDPRIVKNFLGVFQFIKKVLLYLCHKIAVAYYCTAEIVKVTTIYTKTIRNEKPTLLNDNCLTFICILERRSKTISQGIERFLNQNQFSCYFIKDWLPLHTLGMQGKS